MSSSKGTIPSLNDDIYIRILQFATESPSPVYGMDEHVPQETLAACMRVSKNFNILTGPELYRRPSVVDFAAFLKGLRIPQRKSSTGQSSVIKPTLNDVANSAKDGGSEAAMARANRPSKDRPTKLKLLGYVERIDIPHPPWNVNRHYTTADEEDPERMVQFVQKWNAKRSERFAQAVTLLQQLEADQEAAAMVFAKLKAVCLGGLTEMAHWRERPQSSALWKCRMIMATRIKADWISVDTPIQLGLPRLVPLLASIRPLDTICSTMAFTELHTPFGMAPQFQRGPCNDAIIDQFKHTKRPRTEIKHVKRMLGSLRVYGTFIVGLGNFPLTPGVHNIFYCLADMAETTTRAPWSTQYCVDFGNGLGKAFLSAVLLWRAAELDDVLETTSVTIYGLLGDVYGEYTANYDPTTTLETNYDSLAQYGMYSVRTEEEALEWIYRTFRQKVNSDDQVKAAGLADRVKLATVKASVEEPCALCGVGCYD